MNSLLAAISEIVLGKKLHSDDGESVVADKEDDSGRYQSLRQNKYSSEYVTVALPQLKQAQNSRNTISR